MVKLQAVSPLGDARETMGKLLYESPRLRISEAPYTRVLSLRPSRKAQDAEVLAASLRTLGVQAPSKPNGLTGNAQLGCAWLEPNAWLVLAEQELRAVSAPGVLITEISDRVCLFKLAGEAARDLVAAGCDARMVAVNTMARTRFGGMANVIVERHAEHEYRLILDVSLAHAFAGWLLQAASNQ